MNAMIYKQASRRSLIGGTLAVSAGSFLRRPFTGLAQSLPRYSLPMGRPGGIPGDGCYIRHGFDCENVPYLPGWWHTGENWYLIDGDSTGSPVFAAGDGDVVFAGSDYPGRVVIIQHEPDLFSMYGHLAYELLVSESQQVVRGEQIGTVLNKTDGRSPSHLHFEMRSFLVRLDVNGAAPRYRYPCGVNCPPGPGYWPMADAKLPTQMGWRNPMHVIFRRAFSDGMPNDAEAMVAQGAPESLPILDGPGGVGDSVIARVDGTPGDRFRLRRIWTGREATRETSAEAYQVWFEIEYAEGMTGWLRALTPSSHYVSSDGRPVELRFAMLIPADARI
jgi:murein DD-endopeptidase MepM/ murein hydrolase activator NlpD